MGYASTVDIWHHDIQENHIKGMLVYKLDCLLTTVRSHRRKPSAFQASAEEITVGFVIINYE